MRDLLRIFILYILLLSISSGKPDEAFGAVVQVVDGDTVDVDGIGRVKLADIDCPEMETPGGLAAKKYTIMWLLSNLVYLDVDNKTGNDLYGRLVCVVYLADFNGSVNTSRNFNRMLAESDHACIWDFSNNEFNPADWWGGQIPSAICIKGSTNPMPSSSHDGVFVGSTQSNKYHYPSCEWAKKINPEHEIWFSTSEEAQAYGYVPCRVCNPP